MTLEVHTEYEKPVPHILVRYLDDDDPEAVLLKHEAKKNELTKEQAPN